MSLAYRYRIELAIQNSKCEPVCIRLLLIIDSIDIYNKIFDNPFT